MDDRRRVFVLILGMVMSALFVAASMLGAGIVDSVHEARARVEAQDALARFRSQALIQVRRDLLRLDSTLQAGTAQALQRDLLVGRVETSVTSVDSQLMQEPALVTQAHVLAATWHTTVRPAVTAFSQDPTNTDLQRAAHLETLRLETSYDHLVDAVERQRAIRADQELARSRQLLLSVQMSAVGMIVVGTLLLGFVIVALLVFFQMDRAKGEVQRQMTVLNARLRLMSKVAELTQNPVMITDGLGRLTWFNAAFEKLTGWTLHEGSGLTPGALVQGPRTDPVVRRRMHDALANGQGFVEEVTNHHRDGSEFRIRLDVQPIVDGANGPSHYVAVGTDVTQLYQTEMHWRLAKQAADDAARDKSTFLAMFSHEILTPLNTVAGALMLIEDSLTTDDEHHRLVTAKGSIEEIRLHVTNLLTFSALESGRWPSTSAPTDVRALVRACEERMAPRARLNQSQIEVQIEPSVPAAVNLQEGYVEQLLMNLLHSAVAASAQGTVSIEIAVERKADASSLVMIVGDSGPGPDPDDRARINALFLNIRDSLWRRGDGTGLVVATCALIVRQLEGTLELMDRETAGSWYRVSLPLSDLDLGTPQAPDSSSGTSAVLTALGSQEAVTPTRVLVVEDHPINARIAMDLLRAMGAEVEVAGEGNEALALIDGGHDFHLVLMDINLPGADGMEITRAIRRRRDAILQPFIVAHTANVLPGDAERCVASGMDGFLPKPIERAALERVLAESRSTSALIPAPRSGETGDTAAARSSPVTTDRSLQAQAPQVPWAESLALLAEEIGETVATELWEEFVQELPGRLTALDGAAADGDLPIVTSVAHTLAGTAATLRAKELAAACGQVEIAARAGDAARVLTEMPRLHSVAEPLRPNAIGANVVERSVEDDRHVDGVENRSGVDAL